MNRDASQALLAEARPELDKYERGYQHVMMTARIDPKLEESYLSQRKAVADAANVIANMEYGGGSK